MSVAPAPTDFIVKSEQIVFVRESYQTQAIAKIHLDNIRRNLERRLQVAKRSGNNDLVDLLKNECKQIDVS